jgi:hypothetical protein
VGIDPFHSINAAQKINRNFLDLSVGKNEGIPPVKCGISVIFCDISERGK